MFVVTDRLLDEHTFTFGKYQIYHDKSVLIYKNNRYLMLFEGLIYPDVGYSFKDLAIWFEETVISRDNVIDFKKYKGKFSGIFIDKLQDRLLAFNDQLGIRDIYYEILSNRVFVSNDFAQIVNLRKYKHSNIDSSALKEFILFEFALRDKTFIKTVKLLPLASILCFHDKSQDLFNYWQYGFNGQNIVNQDEAIEQLDGLFNQSIKRIIGSADTENTFGLGLSGGLDSRLTAYYALKNGVRLAPFVLGNDESDAYEVARKIASKLDLNLHEVGFDSNFFLHMGKSISVNPMMNVMYTWYYGPYRRLPQFNSLLTGFLGGELFGSHLEKDDINSTDLVNLLYKRFNQKQVKIQGEAEIKTELSRVISELVSHNILDKILEFDFKQRQLKFIKNNPAFNFLNTFNSQSVFEDIDLVEYILRIPAEWKINQTIYKYFHKERIKLLADIKTERGAHFSNNTLVQLEKIIRFIDTEFLQSKIVFKASHKNIGNWLSNNNIFYQNTEKIIRYKSEYFSAVFLEYDLNKMRNKIYQGKAWRMDLFFRLITVKLFIMKYVECVDIEEILEKKIDN